MQFRIGDRVKFLNEAGGGVITKIISPSIVHVAVEEGFDIPTLSSDLLLVEEKPSGQASSKGIPEAERTDFIDSDTQGEVERLTTLLNIHGRKCPAPGVYLAFVPHNQKWLITGKLDIFIVNHTDCDVLYSYLLRDDDGSYTGMDFDAIPPASRILLQTIEREEIRDWNRGILQLLFHREVNRKVPLPASVSFDARESRFSKEDSYSATSIIDGKAMLVTLTETARLGMISAAGIDPKYGHKEIEQNESSAYKQPAFIEKHRIAGGEAEVDLHIEELVENVKGLDVEHILGIQLDYFSRCLESALSSAYNRIVFIHGVGNGTLKTEIKRILDDYQGLEHRPASLAKYGSGAIEVIITHHHE